MWEIISITFTRTTTTISFSHIVFTISVTRVIFTISSTGDHIIPCIRVFHQENDINNLFNYQVRTVIPFTKRTLLHQLLRDHTSTHRYHLYQCYLEQVTRGHNTVADGWAGAPSKTYIKSFKTLVSPLFDFFSCINRLTDQQTDQASYRVACPGLKRNSKHWLILKSMKDAG